MSELNRASAYAERGVGLERILYAPRPSLPWRAWSDSLARRVPRPAPVRGSLHPPDTVNVAACACWSAPPERPSHPIPPQSYILAALGQAGYGCVLLVLLLPQFPT